MIMVNLFLARYFKYSFCFIYAIVLSLVFCVVTISSYSGSDVCLYPSMVFVCIMINMHDYYKYVHRSFILLYINVYTHILAYWLGLEGIYVFYSFSLCMFFQFWLRVIKLRLI